MNKTNFKISLLAAYTEKGRIIGSKGKIPWNIPSERVRFKKLCAGKKVIMGRKTFEEIGHALSYCTIVIVSSTMKEAPEGCMLAKSLEEAIQIAGGDEVLVAGGQSIYEQALPFASKIYATEILKEFEGDRTFPEPGKNWKKILEEQKEDSGIKFNYVTFLRQNSDQH